MRTENLKKLLTGVVTTPSSGSGYARVITPRTGAFVAANGSTASATSSGYTVSPTNVAIAVALSDMMSATLFRNPPGTTLNYKAWSEAVSDSSESSSSFPTLSRYVSATYDETDTPIASTDYALKGTDVACTIVVNDNTKITITFSNSGSEVLHANRIGFSMALTSRLFLMHIFAFDDIALEPGQTKSITIQPDLD